MSFKVATATYKNTSEEVNLKFSKDYDELHPVMRLDCLVDIVHEARKKYKEEMANLEKQCNSETVNTILTVLILPHELRGID